MNNKKAFDEYSNYDDRQLHQNKTVQKRTNTSKEEFGTDIQATKQQAKNKNS